jgi:replication factor C subunit 3/5
MINNPNKYIPFMEKYRPTNTKDIIFDSNNKLLINNIIKMDKIPNLLFYGPPGTGKTTTIINLVKEFQNNKSIYNSENIIHLNASDERGVDVLRNQIHTFITSSSLFHKGNKFIILDEVDYMTKPAQQILIYLLQQHSNCNVSFCLICNYVSRIDDKLLNEMICVRFNKLPQNKIIHLIKEVVVKEHIDISDMQIESICTHYNSDIRGILNYIQINKTKTDGKQKFLFINESFGYIISMIKNKIDIRLINIKILYYCNVHNIQLRNFIIIFFNYIIQTEQIIITSDFLNTLENIVHNETMGNNDIYIYHIITQLTDYL